eukprot:TRINITY_DN858_c0_g1_i1.p1 TRINITY_DN858_c0_g1~~TRINITY_DN858_c0_g1_i1.p1  ORF type:complete len:581 (-),score=139.62 TRINITY_DN858_c0_g1_i1:112-1854(-)
MSIIEDYDVVLDVSSLQQFSEAGWPLYVKRSTDQKVNKIVDSNLEFSGKIVSVLGLYDKGKSFLINKLFHLTLGSGKRVHTRGVSMKFTSAAVPSSNPEEDKKDVLVLDTAGVHSPGKIYDQLSIIDKKSTEMFTQDLVFHLTDFIIVVVNDLTWPDQEYLLALNNKLKKSEKATSYFGVVVVHNFKETDTEEELLALWKEQVVSCYHGESSTVHFGVSVRDEGSFMKAAPKDSDIFYFTSRNPMNDREEMRHVAIAKENSPAGKRYNRLTFELIRRWLDEKSSQKHKLMDEVQSYCNGTMKTYFGQDVTVDLPRLKVDSEQPSQPAPSTSGRSLFSRVTGTSAPETRVVIGSLLSPIQKGLSLKQKVGFNASGLGVYIKSAIESDFTANYDLYDYPDGRRLIRVELPGLKKGVDFRVTPDYATNKLIIEGDKKKYEADAPEEQTTAPTPAPVAVVPVAAPEEKTEKQVEKENTEEEKEEEGEKEKENDAAEEANTPEPPKPKDTPAPTPAPVPAPVPTPKHQVDNHGRKYGKFRAVIDLVEERPSTGQSILYVRDGDLTFENGLLVIPLRASVPKREEW